MKVNILGTEYTIEYRDLDKDNRLNEMEGYTDFYLKQIVVGNIEQRKYLKDEQTEKIIKIKHKILRHEIVHAFLFESGLDCNSLEPEGWAINEEMVDWFAIQSPKIFAIFYELKILGDWI